MDIIIYYSYKDMYILAHSLSITEVFTQTKFGLTHNLITTPVIIDHLIEFGDGITFKL